MKLKLFLVTAALSGATFGAVASAATYDLGVLGPNTTVTSDTINEGSGTSTEDFTFSITGPNEVLSTGAFTEGGPFSITNVDLQLYSAAAPSVLLAQIQYDPITHASETLDASLGAGSYVIDSTTTVPNGESGSYTLTATTVSAAPELSSWVLMIAGLAMTGGVLRNARRKPLAMAV